MTEGIGALGKIPDLMKRLRDNHSAIVKNVPERWLNGFRLSTHVFNTEHQVDALEVELVS